MISLDEAAVEILPLLLIKVHIIHNIDSECGKNGNI